MNNTQAKNGFKTFIITLSISLVIFSALYYVITDSSPEVNIEDDIVQVSSVEVVEEEEAPTVFSTIAMESGKSSYPVSETPSSPVVLSGADTTETTESTSPVPDTGSSEITMGLLVSVVILTLGTYLIKLGPRNLALSSFENRVKKELDR